MSLADAYKDHAACLSNNVEGTLDPIGKLFGNVMGVSQEPPNFDYERPALLNKIEKPVIDEKKRKIEEKVPKKQEPKKKVTFN